MRKSVTTIVASVVSLALAGSALAQPQHYDQGGRWNDQHQQRGSDDRNRGGGDYYYNGRWVDSNEWQRHSDERDQWNNDYDSRYGRHHHHHDDSSALAAGIIGFALGAAIVGSQQDSERARRADRSWEVNCSRRHRSFDRDSGTFLGSDGMRHYC